MGSLPQIEAVLAVVPGGRGGVRLNGLQGLSEALQSLWLRGSLNNLIGHDRRPVRAIMFDKSEATNWALGWHQDRTIAVKRRVEVEGFGPWSRKAGVQHVEPPFCLIERMTTVRIHLDDVAEDNAPLVIAAGSHKLGKIAEDQVDDLAKVSEQVSCLASRGDIWVYSTPILHASAASRKPRRRRVLQVDYSADVLPVPLEWKGV